MAGSTIKTLTLECGLVSVQVKLRGASERKDLSFGRAIPLPGPDGSAIPKRVKRIEVPDPGPEADSLTVEPLRRNKDGQVAEAQYDGELLRGVWGDDDEFYEILPSEIEQIDRLTTIDALTIQEFVPLDEVPWERAQASYFLAPGTASIPTLRGLASLVEAMKQARVAGVAKLMPRSRQKLALVYPKHGGLFVTCLAYANTFEQVSQGAASIEGVEVNPEAVKLWAKLIGAKLADVKALDAYTDDQIEYRADLIERARLGQPLLPEDAQAVEDDEAAPAPADGLIETLRKSIEAVQAQKKAAAKRKPTRKAPASKGRVAAKK